MSTTTENNDVKQKLLDLFDDVLTHDGYGEIRVEMKILKRKQKKSFYIAASNTGLLSTLRCYKNNKSAMWVCINNKTKYMHINKLPGAVAIPNSNRESMLLT